MFHYRIGWFCGHHFGIVKGMKRVGTAGFTIVELLIVVVVIAILAAITIVSYNGITNQTHDAAVQSDLVAMKKKIELFNAKYGRYPSGLDVTVAFAGFKASKGSYAIAPTTDHNLIYCMNGVNGVAVDYSIVSYSKSGKKFRITPNRPAEEYTTAWTNQTIACDDSMGDYTNNYRGYAAEDTTDGPWRAWTGGSS